LASDIKTLPKKREAFVDRNSNDHEEGSSHRIFNKFSSTEAQLYTLRQGVHQLKGTGNVE